MLDAHDVGSNERLFQYIQENKEENINSGPKDVRNSKLCKVEGKIKKKLYSISLYLALVHVTGVAKDLVHGI